MNIGGGHVRSTISEAYVCSARHVPGEHTSLGQCQIDKSIKFFTWLTTYPRTSWCAYWPLFPIVWYCRCTEKSDSEEQTISVRVIRKWASCLLDTEGCFPFHVDVSVNARNWRVSLNAGEISPSSREDDSRLFCCMRRASLHKQMMQVKATTVFGVEGSGAVLVAPVCRRRPRATPNTEFRWYSARPWIRSSECYH